MISTTIKYQEGIYETLGYTFVPKLEITSRLIPTFSIWGIADSSNNKNNYIIEDLGVEKAKIKECKFFLKYEDTFNIDKTMFTPSNLEKI